ncbi:hypothetical protein [Rhodanobacter sp. C01]|uniref:hypothetical protein n=1 Tax=Rhodanobacter sp. C01 TaxID=1945856 RepID=UPI0020C575FC|nr:hypothetical protein [Rhodanobacter sp. C01]
MATNLDTQEQDSAQHTGTDSASSHDANSSGGDVFGLTRDTPSRNTGSDSTGNTSGNSNDRSGSTPAAPAPPRQPHLGWQSLLPGSIQ